MSILDEISNDYERAQALVNILIERATGGSSEDSEYHYQELRSYFVANSMLSQHSPRWLITHRSLSQFWNFISKQSSTYAGRREFLWKEFESLLSYLENISQGVVSPEITTGLEVFSSESINHAWKKALERQVNDPEGAITAGRTLIETVCKHILDEKEIAYDGKIELHKLYKLVSDSLNLSPEQHAEILFKQILGGCSTVINGLGSLRNKLGDAHGKSIKHVRPSSRHAKLVVNLAGAMALFLIETANRDKVIP